MSRGHVRPAQQQPECRPRGDLTPLPEQRYVCRCGEELRLVRASAEINDWAHETLSGQRYRDDRSALLREDPARWWAQLRQRMAAGDMRAAQLYSTLTAAEDLGWGPGWHYHRPEKTLTGPPEQPPPVCCGRPMWASPDGWACRVTLRVFPYTPTTG
ncbi:hypothetical protein EDC02_7680 [Micromonospora sp. Llam0]|uniref:hypothetical protein n=1 Tax=Micromonospora sp. Llam0 TaxID=2485143 RepID=UPI000F489ED3|nr:hypothetical protein [Micromonospora sp. Llam0]ROO52739.1 hypothetical protein EDC02_7680 [Micromonospora sp. Llam0]